MSDANRRRRGLPRRLLALLLFAALPIARAADLYAVLGISSDASEKEIKKAYRTLSLKYHPDKNPGDADAKNHFTQIVHAYEILSDPDSRILFDHGGEEAVAQGANDGGGGGMMDPFEMFFGGGGGGGGGRVGGGGGRGGGKRGADATVELRVTLEEVFNGAERKASISRRVVCRGCKDIRQGSADWNAKCASCGRCPPEIRLVQRQMAPGFMVQQQEQVQSRDFCKSEAVELDALIERGMGDGSALTFERMSEQTPGVIPGDVKLLLRVQREGKDGKDLRTDISISLKEALTGFVREVLHLDGRTVLLSKPAGQVTRPFETLSLKEEGMPVHQMPSQRGTLFARVTVDFPTGPLTAEQRVAVERLF
ncbi:hypothetical protein T492DRAFT_1057189 [Pavlovales sp. CCMP2436]|nr:hypothetical protein T492DRAFT_1057189 [Pavlovales sp. CCMP2436]